MVLLEGGSVFVMFLVCIDLLYRLFELFLAFGLMAFFDSFPFMILAAHICRGGEGLAVYLET